jgi:hypothetical protein
MNMDDQSKAYFSQNQVAEVARQMNAVSEAYEQLFEALGKQMFVDMVDIKDASAAVAMVRNHVDSAIDLFQAHFPDTGSIACTNGCHHCCYFPIECPPQIAVDIAGMIKKQWSEEKKQQLIKKFKADMQDRKAPFFRAPCPFLDEKKLCLIYENRPLSCQWFTSPDPELCRQSVADGTHIPQQPARHRIYQVATTMLLACARKQQRHDQQVGLIQSLAQILELPQEIPTWKGYHVV